MSILRLLLCLTTLTGGSIQAEEVIALGTRRELFVDSLLIEKLTGVEHKLHSPAKVTSPPRPFGHYSTVLFDQGIYRLYYRGDLKPGMHWKHDGWGPYHENEVTLYAESKDGLSWLEPNLGLYDFPEMPKGNVVLADHFLVTHNFTPFVDANPDCPESRKYKALGGGRYPDENWGGWPDRNMRKSLREKYGHGGLYPFASRDGIHWEKLSNDPVLTESQGNFDSQNVTFWSEAEQQYVCYFRIMRNGLRSIRRATSRDFLHWSEPVDMEANLPGEHLYTSGTQPYFRAPHIYIATPTRFQSNRGSITDVVFMSTRPGSHHYERPVKEAFLRPGLGPGGWGNRSNYVTQNVVPDGPNRMLLYLYGGGIYSLRTDGFLSLNAGYEEGEFLSKPITFSGDRLELNYSTSAAGMIRVELQELDGTPIEGFRLDESAKIWGDEISRFVKWNGSNDLSRVTGKTVRLRFVMNEADIFSLRFPEDT